MLLDSNFQFEMKVCPECKIEKMKVANFSLKGTYCRECLRLKSRKRECRGYGNCLTTFWVDNHLDSWIFILALRSLGIDTGCLHTAAQLAIYDGVEIAFVVQATSDFGKAAEVLPGVRQVILPDPSRQPYAEGDLPPTPDFPAPGSHILLTSGTTGRHKRILTGFGGERGRMERRRQRSALYGSEIVQPGEDSVLTVFNMALWTGGGHNWPIFTWCLGGAVVLDQSSATHRALDWPGLTHALVTPFHLSMLMSQPAGTTGFDPRMQLVVGAGALSPALARETIRRLTPNILIEVASTEAGVWAGTVVRSEDDVRWYRPYPERRVELVDEAGAPVGPGVFGALRIRSRPEDPTGYFADPATTAAFFSGGWFYPGDLGEMDAAGRIALHGRSSDIVHVNGEKHPAEPWESAIQRKLGCDAVCLVSGAWRGAEELHVFIENRQPILARDLAQAIRSTLTGFSEYKVHPVTSLPRTETGKIKRAVLAQLIHQGAFEINSTRRF